MKPQTLFNLIFDFPKQNKKSAPQNPISQQNLQSPRINGHLQTQKEKQQESKKLRQCNFHDTLIKNIIKELNRLWNQNSQEIERVCNGNSKLLLPAKMLCDDSVPTSNKASIITMFTLMISSPKVKDYLAKLNIPLYIFLILTRNFCKNKLENKQAKKLENREIKSEYKVEVKADYFKRKETIEGIKFIYSWIKMGEKLNRKISRLAANFINACVNQFNSMRVRTQELFYAAQSDQVCSILLQIAICILTKDLQIAADSGLLATLFRKCIDGELAQSVTKQIIQIISNLYNFEENRLIIDQMIDFGKAFAVFTNVDLRYKFNLPKSEREEKIQEKIQKNSKLIQTILSTWSFSIFFLKQQYTLRNFIACLKGKSDKQIQVVFQNIFQRIIKRVVVFNEKFNANKRKFTDPNYDSLQTQKRRTQKNGTKPIFFISNCLNYRDLLILHSLLNKQYNFFQTLQMIDKNGSLLRSVSSLITHYFPKFFQQYQDKIIKYVSPLQSIQYNVKKKFRQEILQLKSFCMDCVIDYEFSMIQLRDCILFLVKVQGIPQENIQSLYQLLEQIKKKSATSSFKEDYPERDYSPTRKNRQTLSSSKKYQNRKKIEHEIQYSILFKFLKTIVPTLYHIPWETKYLKISSFLSAIIEQLKKAPSGEHSFSDQLFQVFKQNLTQLFSQNANPNFYRYLIVNLIDDFAKHFSNHQLVTELIFNYYKNQDYVYRVSRLILHLDNSDINFQVLNWQNKQRSASQNNSMGFNPNSGFRILARNQVAAIPERDLQTSQCMIQEQLQLQRDHYSTDQKQCDTAANFVQLHNLVKSDYIPMMKPTISQPLASSNSSNILQRVCKEGSQPLVIQTLQFIKKICIDNEDKRLVQSAMKFVCNEMFKKHQQSQQIIKTVIQFCEQLVIFDKKCSQYLKNININQIKFKNLQRRTIYMLLDSASGFAYVKQKWPSFLKEQIELWIKSPHQYNLLKQISQFMSKESKKYSYLKDTEQLDFGFKGENRKKLSDLPWSIAVNSNFFIAMAAFNIIRQRIKLRAKINMEVTCKEINVSVVNIGSNFIRNFSDNDNDSVISVRIQEIQKAYAKNKNKQKYFWMTRGIATLYFYQKSENQSTQQFVLQKITAGISLVKEIQKPLTFPLTFITLMSRTAEGINFLKNESNFVGYLINEIQQQNNLENMKGATYCLGILVNSSFMDLTEKYDLINLFMRKMDGNLKKSKQSNDASNDLFKKSDKTSMNIQTSQNSSNVSLNLAQNSNISKQQSSVHLALQINNINHSQPIYESPKISRSLSMPQTNNLLKHNKNLVLTTNLELIQLYFWIINIFAQYQDCRNYITKDYGKCWQLFQSKNGQWLCFPTKEMILAIGLSHQRYVGYDRFSKIKNLDIGKLKVDEGFKIAHAILNQEINIKKLKQFLQQPDKRKLIFNPTVFGNLFKYMALMNFPTEKVGIILQNFTNFGYIGSQKFDNDFPNGFLIP